MELLLLLLFVFVRLILPSNIQFYSHKIYSSPVWSLILVAGYAKSLVAYSRWALRTDIWNARIINSPCLWIFSQRERFHQIDRIWRNLVKPFLFKFLTVLILTDVLHIILLCGVHILICYNSKLTFEETLFLVLYITNLTVHGQQKRKVDVLSYNVRIFKGLQGR